jgi:AmmeMemoRadiSam system protein B
MKIPVCLSKKRPQSSQGAANEQSFDIRIHQSDPSAGTAGRRRPDPALRARHSLILGLVSITAMKTIRQPAVAGMFYPDDPERLAAQVKRHLDDGEERLADLESTIAGRPKAIVAPHAGYPYSGPVAGTAFAAIDPRRRENADPLEPITRAIILGPSHRVAFEGISAPTNRAFATPLGDILLDRSAIDDLLDRGMVREYDRAHADEHSIEVELPFLMAVAGPALEIVPLVIGDASMQETADLIKHLLGGPETVIVISTDLSHFLPYEVATDFDAETADPVIALAGDPPTGQRACGYQPLRGLLHLARQRGFSPTLLDLRNSGDTAGSHDSVVGYSAFAFHES